MTDEKRITAKKRRRRSKRIITAAVLGIILGALCPALPPGMQAFCLVFAKLLALGGGP